MTDRSFVPCAVIPVYNHERAVGHVLAAIRQAGLPCFLVDDGSSAECARELDRLTATTPETYLVRLPVNQGKGGAVSVGLRAASATGFSHALQIDADGQHALDDIPRFVEAARAEPDTVICGKPVFDKDMPASRRYGRLLTHALVWLDTLSFDIPDAMCGFRVYPLKPVMALINRQRLGSRMDFDVEILVKLHWTGQRMRWLDTPVSYPMDGVSHFRLIWDNARMVALHTRLVPGMLVRSPLLLWRKVR